MLALDNGFQEVVGLVLDAEASAWRLCTATGYGVVHRGTVEEGALTLLGLPIGTQAREVLIGHPCSTRGMVRLLEIPGNRAAPMREGAQAWDTGGIFDINMRALQGGIEPLHRAFNLAGFHAAAPVADWDFGALSVREVVENDADGLCVALMERISPPLSGYEDIRGPASWVFNSTQIVADFEAARDVLAKGLGWTAVTETTGFASHGDGANCMGFPLGLAPSVPMRIGIYHPRGRMEGSVELIAYGCRTRSFAFGAPPQRGWACLRFPVNDAEAFGVAMAGAGCRIVGRAEFVWEPYGRVCAVAALTPWGARFEALQRLD
jgi:hypothetical protein